jgi:hypothetical protein
MRRTLLVVLALAAVAVWAPACTKKSSPAPTGAKAADAAPAPGAKRHDALPRADFNRWAVRLNLPVYWIADTNKDGSIDPSEMATLLFYPAPAPAFEAAYDQIVAAAKAPPAAGGDAAEQERRALVADDLDGGRATLVLSDLTGLSEADKAFAHHMLTVADRIDALYDVQTGAAALAGKVPADDVASQSLFRRNRGPRCATPKAEKNPACSAIPGSPKPLVDVYPIAMQADPSFCKTLEKDPQADKLLTPFTAVREKDGKLVAVPYHEVWPDKVKAIADELRLAADALGADERPLAEYLRAAAKGFETDQWQPADEAWAKLDTENSKWYVRAAPDETYWDPCAHHAGYHLTFARINRASLEWQKKLTPVQQDMEQAVAARAGEPYQARKVTFHLPDFIDIVVNAGDDRGALGATIGESLPNWGPVANEGRGRTVAMSNLYTDPDSMATRRAQAASVLDAASLAVYVDSPEPGLLSTILHEATHNLGPAHEYKVGGKADELIFGGPLAAIMEELKAQTGALFLVEFLHEKGILDDDQARRVYTDCVVWAFGHISQGMRTPSGDPKTYSQLAAIQVGFLIEQGAITWDANAPAANGTDKGAFTLHLDKFPAAADAMMSVVAGIKARGDKKGAEGLIAKYVDGAIVPQQVIQERYLRFPKASFVYAVTFQARSR